MTCTAMFAFKLQANKKHMPISKMPKHGILNRCGSQTSRVDDDFFFSPFFFMVLHYLFVCNKAVEKN